MPTPPRPRSWISSRRRRHADRGRPRRAKSITEKDFDELFSNAQSLAMALSESESWGSWKLLLARREQTKASRWTTSRPSPRVRPLENRVVGVHPRHGRRAFRSIRSRT